MNDEERREQARLGVCLWLVLAWVLLAALLTSISHDNPEQGPLATFVALVAGGFVGFGIGAMTRGRR